MISIRAIDMIFLSISARIHSRGLLSGSRQIWRFYNDIFVKDNKSIDNTDELNIMCIPCFYIDDF